MIRILPITLNTFGDAVHPVASYATDTLVHYCPDLFSRVTTLSDADCIITNAPACPPYCFDQKRADSIIAANKPIFILNDADGAMPDCEGQSPDKEHNFQNFVRGGNGIRAYFYREWFKGYERPDLPFPLLTFELVGYLWSNHPKDKADWLSEDTLEQFKARPNNIFFAQSLNCQSRIALYKALKDRAKCSVRDLYKTGKAPATAFLLEQSQAKITIALEGSGIKCMSTHEAPLNSVMAMADIDMNWTCPWVHGENCIRLVYEKNKGEGSLVHNFGRGLIDVAHSIARLDYALESPHMLYGIMQRGMDTALKYSLPNYYREHVGASIIKYL